MEYFIKAQKLDKRQTCWALYLLRFEFILKHVLGTKIEKVNWLNKRQDWKVKVENNNNNNNNQILIKE